MSSQETAVGTIAVEYESGRFELSWTVAPEARGKGFGRIVMSELASELDGHLYAEIRVGNAASIRIAEEIGMARVSAFGDLLQFERKPVGTK